MNDENARQIYAICSYLLSYPTSDFINTLNEALEWTESLPVSSSKEKLEQFFSEIKILKKSELIATYTNTFDFGKKTNLYITYMSNGEQRERGMDLLFLKNYYKLHGFAVTDKELPDYLPIILEFASQVDYETIEPVFSRYLRNIEEISNQLKKENNVYRHIFHAILLAINETREAANEKGVKEFV